MSRLDDLYKAIETMRREHLSTADLEAKVSLAEEEIIKNEILPVLKQNIEPALQPVKRELVLVVDYVPGNPLSVHLSRKRNFAAEIPDAKEIVITFFTHIFYNMYMNGSVVVRIEHKSKTKYYKQCRHNSNIICILWNNAAKIQTIFHSSKHFSDYLQLFGFSQLHPITPSVTCHMDFGKSTI